MTHNTLSKIEKSNLFRAYNKATAAARQGKLEAGRVRKALGLVQKIGWESQYGTTIKTCSCPDTLHSGQVCKHRIALMIKQRMFEYQNPYPLTTMSNGYAVAWQKFGGYSIIWIDTPETWDKVKVQYESQGQLVRPSEAHGRRLGDYNHSWMTEELFVPEIITY